MIDMAEGTTWLLRRTVGMNSVEEWRWNEACGGKDAQGQMRLLSPLRVLYPMLCGLWSESFVHRYLGYAHGGSSGVIGCLRS